MDTAKKVTIYARSDFGMGYHRIEAHLVSHGTRQYAQYAAAPYVDFKPKRARRVRRLQQSYRPSLVILEGWDTPEPPAAFVPATESDTGCLVSRSKYASCDPRWDSDFDAMLDSYLKYHGHKLVADYRVSEDRG